MSKELILIWDKQLNSFVDKTSEIFSIQDAGHVYQIRFEKNKKVYSYAKDSVRIYSFLREIKVRSDQVVIVNNQPIFNVNKVEEYSNKVFKVYRGKSYDLMNNVIIKSKANDLLANNFDYFKALASYSASIDYSEFSVGRMLFRQYDKVKSINPATVLNYYLKGLAPKQSKAPNAYFFPFDFNMSQIKAIKNAFSSNVSIVEGPPGCGKTQTILNFIANAVIQNKTIAIVSNNNSAIENILEKLEEKNLSFFTALLGRLDNKIDFFENITCNQSVELFNKTYPSSSQPEPSFRYEARLKILQDLSNAEIHLKKVIVQLEEIKKEFDHFKLDVSNKVVQVKKLTSDEYRSLSILLANVEKIGFFKRRQINRKLKIKLNNVEIKDLIDTLDFCFYEEKISELKSEITKLEKLLVSKNFEQHKSKYQKDSMLVFIDRLKDIAKSNRHFDLMSYQNDFNSFVSRYPVILSTSYSLLGSIPEGAVIDYVIFDEASQSDLISSTIGLKCAKNLVVVGDSNQLPEIISEQVFQFSEKLVKENKIKPEYWVHQESILSSVKKVFPNAPLTLLKEHYRCNPKIINFCNMKYYNDQLVIMTKPTSKTPFEIIHTEPGNHARRNPNGPGMYNQREIDEIKAMKFASDDVGIITPFRYQANLISKAINNKYDCDTVHKFQGRQKGQIILSTVLNTLSEDKPNRLEDFVTNEKLLNVAISRAADKLTLLVSDSIYHSNANTPINELIKYIKYQSDKVIKHGLVSSVFDVLYSANKDELNRLLAKSNKQGHASELVFEQLLLKVLADYPDLDYKMHVSLTRIVSAANVQDADQRKYLSNRITHVDFLIFNKITKQPLYVIEIDGVKYHEQNQKQSVHDSWKDDFLISNGIKVLRLKTNQSNEEEKIRSLLNT